MSELLQIIGNIYDAALDDDQWGVVLQRTSQFLKCVNVSLGSFNLPQQSTNLTRLWGYKPEYLDSFRDRYRKFSPLVVRAGDAPVGVSVSVTDVMPYKQFQQTAFYREWTKPQGHVDALLVNLTKSKMATTFVLGGRHRRVGMVDQEMRKRMNLLSPHLRRAILIRDVINVPHVEAAALADTLDGLSAALFLVDADAHIIHANASGNTLIDHQAVLRSAGGKLVVKDSQADDALRNVFMAAGRSDLAVGGRGIAVSLSGRNNERFVAHVLPLTGGARRRASSEYSAVAAVFVRKAESDLRHPITTIADTYKLTPAEMRVLMVIVNFGGVPEAAQLLGISETTVKTHLQRVFQKTNTNRQAELVKLVAGFMSPFG